jgi:NtrC-family two-component system sensor histidine kinase KinB
MFKTLRTKLLIGIAPLLAIMVGLGLWAIVMFYRLGGNIDVILRENYNSVRAAQGMKEALERMDSAVLFAIGGQEAQAVAQFRENIPIFKQNLEIEQNNITLPGENELADEVKSLFDRYIGLSNRFFALAPGQKDERTRMYFSELLPTFNRIKDRADDVLNVNQRNMKEMDRKARNAASLSIRLMAGSLVGAAVVATLLAWALSRSILEPIQAVTRATRAMARGDLDQVVPVLTRDELGELAVAFNTMARTIREFQQAGTARLLRAQKTAQATIDSFPDPVVVVDPTGAVERANPAAHRILGVSPTGDGPIPWTAPTMLRPPLAEVLGGRDDFLPTSLDHSVAFRDNGQERYFLPRVLAIRDDRDALLGAAVVLSDVTKFRLVDQLKSDMVATVSHELKTPLTSMQMAVHLLLEEAIGPLTPKQVELLLAARQDSDRLLAMVNDLLDLTRIEQGRLKLDLRPVSPGDLITETIARNEMRAQDAGIELETKVAPGLAPVEVDRERIDHVFDNLIGNALRHTERGGTVRVSARPGDEAVEFSVEDTGEGIPAEHLPRIFEKFYRVPGSKHHGGAGLGLAITREIVMAHGGQIAAASRPGAGATFTFTLPTDTLSNGRAGHDGAIS